MKVSKGQSQPEMVAAAFLILYMVLGSPFLYQVLIVTHSVFVGLLAAEKVTWASLGAQRQATELAPMLCLGRVSGRWRV